MAQIYHLFCTVTGKSYVGQTWRTAEERWRHHQTAHSFCVKFYNAIRKYGAGAFALTVLTELPPDCTQADLDAAEGYWMDFFDCIRSGYNLRAAGQRGKITEESRKKLSDSLKAHYAKPGAREALSQSHLGREHSEETRAKIAAKLQGHTYNVGKAPSIETRAKISVALTGKRASPEARAKMSAAAKARVRKDLRRPS